MNRHQEVPQLPEYLSLGNGFSTTEPREGNSEAHTLSSTTLDMSTVDDSTVATSTRHGKSLSSGGKVQGNREIEVPSQQLTYRVSIQKQLDVVSQHLELFAETSKSILDVAGSICKSAELSAEVVQKNFDALAAELAGNRELLLHTIETRRKNVVCKLEQRASDIAKAKCGLQRASEIGILFR